MFLEEMLNGKEVIYATWWDELIGLEEFIKGQLVLRNNMKVAIVGFLKMLVDSILDSIL